MAQIGEVISGRYRLERRIGRGGFGTVYEAFDGELRRAVALKLLDPKVAASDAGKSAELRERFRREAAATASIPHPSVVTIFDVGVTDDRQSVFIVMELLRGHPLGTEIARHPDGLDPERCIPLFVAALEGLGVGHLSGIVHKDLNPANLFLTQPGTSPEALRVIDFGVARVVHDRRLTATGKIVGTPRYLAPEYIREHRVSPALDVYQMGLILVETLCGRPCIPNGTPLLDSCGRHMTGNLEIPNWLREGALGPVISRATDPRVSQRYANGQEFAAALREIDPRSVHPANPIQHVVRDRTTSVFPEASTLRAPAPEPVERPSQTVTAGAEARSTPWRLIIATALATWFGTSLIVLWATDRHDDAAPRQQVVAPTKVESIEIDSMAKWAFQPAQGEDLGAVEAHEGDAGIAYEMGPDAAESEEQQNTEVATKKKRPAKSKAQREAEAICKKFFKNCGEATPKSRAKPRPKPPALWEPKLPTDSD